MAIKYMRHNGKHQIVIPAVKAVRINDNPRSKYYGLEEEYIAEEEKVEVQQLPKGTRFGDYVVGEIVAVSDPEHQKALVRRGFEFVEEKKAISAEKKKDTPQKQAEAVIARDQEIAAEKQIAFESKSAEGGE